MGYDYYIVRETGRITLPEWINAVESVIKSVEGVKIDSSDMVGMNPITKEEIRMPGRKGSVSFWFEEYNNWVKCILFNNNSGSARFGYTMDSEIPDNKVNLIVNKLIDVLNAKIISSKSDV